MTTTLPTAEQVSERLIDALNNLASLRGAENADLIKVAEAADFIAAQAAEIERLAKERDDWKAARDACENAYQKTMIASLRNLDRAETAEASLAAVTAERDAMREALIGARTAIKAFHGPLAWEIYEHNAPEMKAIDAALSLDAQVKP